MKLQVRFDRFGPAVDLDFLVSERPLSVHFFPRNFWGIIFPKRCWTQENRIFFAKSVEDTINYSLEKIVILNFIAVGLKEFWTAQNMRVGSLMVLQDIYLKINTHNFPSHCFESVTLNTIAVPNKTEDCFLVDQQFWDLFKMKPFINRQPFINWLQLVKEKVWSRFCKRALTYQQNWKGPQCSDCLLRSMEQ